MLHGSLSTVTLCVITPQLSSFVERAVSQALILHKTTLPALFRHNAWVLLYILCHLRHIMHSLYKLYLF